MCDFISSDIYNKELTLRQKELELKEKELELKEKELELNMRIREFEIKELQRQNTFIKIQNNKVDQYETIYNAKINELLRMKQNKQYWNNDAFNDILLEGDIDKIIWLKNNLCPFGESAYYYAFLNGNVTNLDWLLANGYLINPKLYKCAFKTGKLEMVEWLKNNNCPFDQLTGKYVCELNNIDLLNYLKINNYNFKTDLINDLFESDIKLETFKWLKNNGQEFNENTMCIAIYNRCKRKNSTIILNWLVENNCPWGILTNETKDCIIKCKVTQKTVESLFGLYTENEYSVEKNVLVLAWLIKNNCEWNVICNVNKYGEESIIWDYCKNDTSYIEKTLSEFIKNNKISFIKWCIDMKLLNKTNINELFESILRYAIRNDYWDILNFMVDSNIKPTNNVINFKKPSVIDVKLNRAIDILKNVNITVIFYEPESHSYSSRRRSHRKSSKH
jgi:hypothetical protein